MVSHICNLYLYIKLRKYRRPQEIVYVVVGPEGKKFGVHKDQLCASSDYLKAAFGGSFQEAVRGEVVLKETSAMAFGMMVEWLYTGKITEELCQDRGLSNADKLAKDKPTIPQLLDVWILADYLLAPQLQNFLVNMMESKHMKRAVPPVNDFTYFYQHTQKGSPMRQFLVDLCIFRFRGEDGNAYRTNIGFMPREMASDIMITLARRADGLEKGPPFAGRKYHVPVMA